MKIEDRFCPCFVSPLFCIELYFELFSCNAPASARRVIKNLLTYLLKSQGRQ